VAWGRGGLFPSLEDGWRSNTADDPNSNNLTGYKSVEMDRLIDAYLEEFDETRRIDILKQVDLLLTKDMPSILLWGGPYRRVFFWNKFKTLPELVEKYADISDGESVFEFWSIDKEKLNRLKKAMQNNTSLPDELINVYYDESIKKKYGSLSY